MALNRMETYGIENYLIVELLIFFPHGKLVHRKDDV
jgi:hypothetical protein